MRLLWCLLLASVEEFAAAHRRIITELYGKKKMAVTWQQDQPASLAGLLVKRLTFTSRLPAHRR